MSSIVAISLARNNLVGSLPSNHSIHSCRLRSFSAATNRLSGRLPSTFARCLDLQLLSLMGNNLTGSVPADLGHLLELQCLSLLDNQLTGEIPSSLGNLTNLEYLDVSFNNFGGGVPKELGYLLKVQYLQLGKNSLRGSIPKSLLNASNIRYLGLEENMISGSVPPTFGESMPSLERLNIATNSLTGGLDFISSLQHCKNLRQLLVGGNKLDGFLPNSVGNFSSSSSILALGQNKINGKIPIEIGNLSSLMVLDLVSNNLVGAIPPNLARLHNLQYMVLAVNKIGGTIPFEFGLMRSLNILDLGSNQLSGVIPDSLGNLTRMQHFSLDDNKLSSKIPQSLWKLNNLIELRLSRNALFGLFPSEVGNLNVLDILDLTDNKLSGNITNALGELKMLTYLNLANNSFHGQIPESLGGLINIKYMDLSKNYLSYFIPKSLANLRYLEHLNLSFNMLEGQIPEGKVFSNISIPSLEGNKALCGATRLGFPPCTVNSSNSHLRRNMHLLIYILPILTSMVALSFLILICMLRGKRKTSTLARTDSLQLGKHKVITYHDLVRATDNFSHENLLGKGSFSSVFKGYLDDGMVVAVKVLNLEIAGATKSFEAECQALCNVRHRNLIRIISICFNLDFKAIILPYMPNGSLDQWLYYERNRLNLLQRLNIMVDVSLALEHLHHHNFEVILHCDLKPSNILLDGEMVAHVSDFGIAKLMLGNRSAASTSLRGTIGYIAPEYGSTGEVSKMSDVYSFGILLLETFTGRRPTDAMFGGESTLRECICKAYPEALLGIIDGNMLKDASLIETQLEDQTATIQFLTSIIGLGLMCSNYSPKERISMIDVANELRKIKSNYFP